MALISASPVGRQRVSRSCALCHGNVEPGEPVVRLYGGAWTCDQPYRIYLCVWCALESGDESVRDAAALALLKNADVAA